MTLRTSIGRALAASLALVLLPLAGCQKQIEAPYETGVCWKMEFLEGGKVRFNKLADHRPNLESCAAALEGLRLRNLGFGQNATSFIGAYQGNFLFLNQYGVFTAPSLTAARYPALVRTGDGRLAVPGSVVP
jgi:hypothetical protein